MLHFIKERHQDMYCMDKFSITEKDKDGKLKFMLSENYSESTFELDMHQVEEVIKYLQIQLDKV